MLDLFAPLGYDIVVLCFVWFIARNLIHFWCMQNAVKQNFVDKEMMKLQLDFQKSLREMDGRQTSDFPENVQ